MRRNIYNTQKRTKNDFLIITYIRFIITLSPNIAINLFIEYVDVSYNFLLQAQLFCTWSVRFKKTHKHIVKNYIEVRSFLTFHIMQMYNRCCLLLSEEKLQCMKVLWILSRKSYVNYIIWINLCIF